MDRDLAFPPMNAILPGIALHPDEAHGEKKFSGVTRVLRDAGIMRDFEVSQDILDRGSDVHKACHYHNQNDLDLRTVPIELRGYVHACEKFKLDLVKEVILSEHFVSDPIYMIRGRLDCLVKLNDKSLALVDWKTGAAQPFTRLQLALYGYCYDRKTIFRRIAVELRSEGSYNTFEYPVREYIDDYQTGLGAMRVIQWKRRFGL